MLFVQNDSTPDLSTFYIFIYNPFQAEILVLYISEILQLRHKCLFGITATQKLGWYATL